MQAVSLHPTYFDLPPNKAYSGFCQILFSTIGSQKYIILSCLVCGLTVAAIVTVSNYVKLGASLATDLPNTVLIAAITFISAAVTALIALEIVYFFNKRKQSKIEKQLDENE